MDDFLQKIVDEYTESMKLLNLAENKLQKTIEYKTVELAKLAVEKSKLKLETSCNHPKEYLYTDDEYYEGSYLDHASTTHITKCKLCNQIVNTVIEMHSWYG